ncbi:hypothetical protein BST61_g4201 [Cercospora zeina]
MSSSATSAQDTYNGIPVSAILFKQPDDDALVERISFRKVPWTLDIVESDPQWPQYFEVYRSRIMAAWTPPAGKDEKEATVLSVLHVGSTSVPGLPAKAIIDIDLILSNNTLDYESYYVPRLEAAGFQYILREPGWYEHRFFVASEPVHCNLHVFGPRCPEAERHIIFRDWLRGNSADRELYARTKMECAQAATAKGETMDDYSDRKESVVREILARAYAALGILVGDE